MTTAIVMGGGFCGLLTATVLSKRFDDVKVIERTGPDVGVPQQHHIHVLQAKGLEIIEALLPDIQRDMLQAGAVKVRWTADTTLLLARGAVIPRRDVGLYSLALSRQALQAVLFKRVSQLANVTFLLRTRVDRLIRQDTTISGIQITNLDNNESQILACDFLADCTGRRSRSAQWLQALGYDEVQKSEINAFLGYASRFYRIPEGMPISALGMGIQPRPTQGFYRGAAVGVLENQQLIITLAGLNKDYPPTDEQGFRAFADSLPLPDVAACIEQCEPLSPIYGYRAHNRLMHYDRMKHFPDNYVVLGDAVCFFNPMYGQGMMVSAQGVALLQSMLANQDNCQIGQQFQRRLRRLLWLPWTLARVEDLRYPLVEGQRPGLFIKMLQGYLDLLLFASSRDETVGRTVLRVIQRTLPARMLAHPVIMFRALGSFLVSPQR